MSSDFNPGSFDRNVSWQTVTTTRTGMGSPSKTYTHSFYAYMSRRPVSGNQEQYVTGRGVLPFRFIYRGHYKSDMNETMIIVDGSVKYNVLSVDPVQNNMFVEILAERVTE